MKKRFIILIDFSEYASNLIKYAYNWSLQINAELLLIHQTIALVPAFAGSDNKEKITSDTNKESLDRLQELAGSVLPASDNISYLVSEEPLQSTLPRLFSQPFENLVFVGLKGTGYLKKILLGSTVIRLMENTNNIIVAIPQEMKKFSHEKIFVAVTETHPVNVPALNKFFQFIDKSPTRVTFFYLAKPNEETKQIETLLQNFSSLFSHRFETSHAIYEGDNAFKDIRKVINNKIDELLIVQKGSRLFTDQLFRKFLINELVYEGQTPLIILPQE